VRAGLVVDASALPGRVGERDASLVLRGSPFTRSLDRGRLSIRYYRQRLRQSYRYRARADPVGHNIIGTDGSVPGTVRRSVDRWPGFTFANFDTEQRASLDV
jgi:hypothetical protein